MLRLFPSRSRLSSAYDLPYGPFMKMRFLSYEERVVPRTIKKKQDTKLREMADRTGRSISALVREAAEQCL